MIDNEFLSGNAEFEKFCKANKDMVKVLGALTPERAYNLKSQIWIGWHARCHEVDSLRQQLDALELSRRSWMDEAKSLEGRVDVLKSLLLEANELFYSVEGELSALSAQEVDAMRGKVFTALKKTSIGVAE